MSGASYKFEKANRSLLERLFEPPAVGKMSPVAKVVAYAILFFWSLFVIFPLYWVIITAFKNGQIVNEGPYYIPFVDFQPTLDGWRAQFATDPFCDLQSVGTPDGALRLQLLRLHRVTRRDDSGRWKPQICKVWLAFTNSHRNQYIRHCAVHDHWQHGGPMRWPASSTSRSSATS